ncbi:hypothetical protein H9L39_01393 [Fusarium oxysporum f. sp. albedinis]|nr:hypothetical protein H9L39_01393 [Fusarium oxysporum f. sp. albedinis]
MEEIDVPVGFVQLPCPPPKPVPYVVRSVLSPGTIQDPKTPKTLGNGNVIPYCHCAEIVGGINNQGLSWTWTSKLGLGQV